MTNKEIGQLLQNARKKSGKSQSMVAKDLGMQDRTTIAHYERGQYNFTAEFLDRYCAAVGHKWAVSLKQLKKSAK